MSHRRKFETIITEHTKDVLCEGGDIAPIIESQRDYGNLLLRTGGTEAEFEKLIEAMVKTGCISDIYIRRLDDTDGTREERRRWDEVEPMPHELFGKERTAARRNSSAPLGVKQKTIHQ